MNNRQQESNTHIVNKFDGYNHTFIVTETQFLLQTPISPRRFRVMLQSQKCDGDEYQAKHLLCSHVMAAYKFVYDDPMNYVTPLFTLQHILYVYDNSFGLLSHMNQCGKNNMKEINGAMIQGERGLQKVVSFQLTFLMRWTKTKMNIKIVKKM